MKMVYFAWVREKVGVSSEELAPPADVATVTGLIEWLRGQGAGYEAAFADLATVRVAVNQVYAALDAPVSANDEVAFFPPVTGG
ncbi:MAG: molybdopterin converting factor subunit 1 [Rhodospirillaceae bacterium]|jgi:sulfur-carrier protein|nr:molybdopterin converting factor subunit 1 [Rhodospirillaceae bacterium]